MATHAKRPRPAMLDTMPPAWRSLGSRRRRSHGRADRLLAIPFALGLALLACETPIQVDVDVDPDVHMNAFQSYAWISKEPLIPQVKGVTTRPPISPIDDKRIRTAVDAQLAAKGWKEVGDPDQADLVVSYGIGAESKTEVVETPNASIGYGRVWGHPYGYGYGNWYAGSTVRTKQYTQGSLTLEFFDRQKKQAVWVGWASTRLASRNLSSEARSALIQRAITKILGSFPPAS